MHSFEIAQKWHSVTPDRECGSCYACCVYLGIEELKKHSGQTCKHLRGTSDPSKRCSIYASRPVACANYYCLWKAGWGPAELQPHLSGILITCYDAETKPGWAATTVQVFDEKLAKPHIEALIGELVLLPMMYEVRLVFLKAKRATLFREGKVYDCQLLPPEGFESLIFQANLDPIGTYYVMTPGEAKPE